MSLTSKKTLIAALMTAGIVGAGDRADAANETMDISASVADACSFTSVSDLAFGEYTPGQTNTLDAASDIQIDCTVGATVTMAFDKGGNTLSANNNRQMDNGSSGLLEYQLLLSGNPVGDSGATHTDPAQPLTLASGTTTVPVLGLIPGNQTAPGGTYADTVNITMTF